MALTENIGYDATGDKTFKVTVESEEHGNEKVEIQRCDLLDYRVWYDWNHDELGWSERRREVISGTGIVGEYQKFKKDPTPFLV